MEPGRTNRRAVSPAGFAVVGSEMVGFTLLGVGIDYFAGSRPWATVVCTLLGLVVAMGHLIRMANAATARKPDGAAGP